jgi:DNA-binding CsgD family transcriptional regulator
MALDGLGLAALAEGDLVAARTVSDETLNVHASSVLWAGTLFNLGHIAVADEDYAAARQHLFQLLELLANGSDAVGTAHVLEALAHLAARLDRLDLALRLAAAAEAVQETLAVAWSPFLGAVAPVSLDLRDRWLVPLRTTLDAEETARWWSNGRQLSLTEAVELAQTELRNNPAPAAPPAVSDAYAPLTPRQLEVAVLVGQGLTNRQIAERLVVSERAAAAHIENILNRLGVSSRTQIAVWTSERGLLAKRAD